MWNSFYVDNIYTMFMKPIIDYSSYAKKYL